MESIVPIMDSKDFVLVRTHGLIVHHPDDIALLHPNRLVVSVVVPLDVAPEPLLQPLQQAFLYSHKQSVRDLPPLKQSLRKDTEIASNWRIAKGTYRQCIPGRAACEPTSQVGENNAIMLMEKLTYR